MISMVRWLIPKRMSLMTAQMRTEQEVLRRLAETHAAIRPLLAQISDGQFAGGGMDDVTRDHIRSINLHIGRMADEMRGGREQTVEQIRSEIRLLARTIAALAEEG